jgi:hypothetical protein
LLHRDGNAVLPIRHVERDIVVADVRGHPCGLE